MTTSTPFEVSTKVLIDQARVTLRELAAPQNQARLQDLARQGLKLPGFPKQLEAEVKDLADQEVAQERAKQAYLKEAQEDQDIVEEGYRWVLRLTAKARAYLASVEDDPDDLPGTLRFGKLHTARARGVTYEMRILLPEVEQLSQKLSPYGADAAFVAQGKDILQRLGADLQETTEARATREAITRKVRAGEIRVSRLLRQLVAADEAAALERPEDAPVFRLEMINAELGRLKAMRDARLAAGTGTVSPPD